jgi:hypothetical protein
MNNSTNPRTNDMRTACTPNVFFRGMFRLANRFCSENTTAIVGAWCALVALGFPTLLATGVVKAGVDGLAWWALASLATSLGCGVFTYFMKKHQDIFGGLAIMMAMAYMAQIAGMVTFIKTGLSTGTITVSAILDAGAWWQAASLVVKAAVLPAYAVSVLAEYALYGGAAALAVWGLVKLPKATRAATRYICQAGQAH